MRRLVEILARAPLVVAAAVLCIGTTRLTAQSVPAGTVANRDIIAFDRDVRVGGDVRGDVLLVGGSLTLSGTVRGDVVTIGSNVTFESGAMILGDLVTVGGESAGSDSVNVGGESIVRGDGRGLGPFAKPLSVLSFALQLSLLLVWLVGTVILMLTNGREVRAASVELRASAMHSFTLGLVAITSLVLTLVVLSYLTPYGVGIPLIIAVAVIAVMAKVFGMIAVFHAIGSILFAPRRRDDLEKKRLVRGDLAFAIAGLLLLGAVRLIPVVGIILWMLASVFGIGTALATKFGRREPWFLAVRQMSW